MSAEIECIIPNSFSKSEIIELPIKIDSKWKNLKQYILEESKNFLEPITFERLDLKAKWNFEINENSIEYCWSYYENEITLSTQPKNDIWFFSYFGMIKIYRNTIVINPLNLRYKTFKNENKAKIALVNIMREISKLFKSNTILYCADSSTKTEALSNMCMDGKSLDKIIQYAISNFGIPKPSLFEAIDETYFIDEVKI